MKCPFCNSEETKVTDSRTAGENSSIKRRRECLQCQERFTTFETVDLIIQIQKRDGRFEDFKQEKLTRGLEEACRHTRISHNQIRGIVESITTELLRLQIKEISAKELGVKVMEHLKKMDMIAYIRFACVYRRFKDLDELMQEIHSIGNKEPSLK